MGLKLLSLAIAVLYLTINIVVHAEMDHSSHAMTLDEEGMVMNSNDSAIPEDCDGISEDYAFTVYAGTEFATAFPDTIFGLSEHSWHVPPCSRLTVTFVNKDEVRHQWMVHGLPKYLYPQGMFHLEAAGGATKTGSFIVPSDHHTYLVHCDLAQHMEKGMKGQLVVGKGSGNLPSVPGITAPAIQDRYALGPYWLVAFILVLYLMVVGLVCRRLFV